VSRRAVLSGQLVVVDEHRIVGLGATHVCTISSAQLRRRSSAKPRQLSIGPSGFQAIMTSSPL
jgi:hypothetical protein